MPPRFDPQDSATASLIVPKLLQSYQKVAKSSGSDSVAHKDKVLTLWTTGGADAPDGLPNVKPGTPVFFYALGRRVQLRGASAVLRGRPSPECCPYRAKQGRTNLRKSPRTTYLNRGRALDVGGTSVHLAPEDMAPP